MTRRRSSLRVRWLRNTVLIVLALGLVCAAVVTATFAINDYSNMESDLRYRAVTTTQYLSEYLSLEYDEYYASCIDYAQSFEARDTIELQFINADGQIVASSYGQLTGLSPTTPEIAEAIENRGTYPYTGRDPHTGERIMAVSCPIIYRSGEVIGVLRYVTATRKMDREIISLGLLSLLAVAVVTVVVLLCSSYFLRSILLPIADITEKAKRIAAGSYGIQIQTHGDDEIGELTQAINELSAKVSQNEKLQTEFISSLSHELRTPLTAITGWSETLLGSETLDPETRRGMKIISREAKRLTEMVVELLDFTRIQDGGMTLNIEPSDIQAEFEDTVFMYSSRLSQDGIALVMLGGEQAIPPIPCDPERMRQVFLNILDNAAKHGGEGKRIEASMTAADGRVIAQIRDFGPGIPEDELPLVKKKFYKGSSKARGTGIGLAVCDEIVQMHGGELILENAPGGGTMVTISLPAAQ